MMYKNYFKVVVSWYKIVTSIFLKIHQEESHYEKEKIVR